MTVKQRTIADSLDRTGGSEQDEYERIDPVVEELAALPPGPERNRLREQVITTCIPLADHIAQRYRGRGEPLDDLRQVARIGLVGAVDRYDPARATGFIPYAVPSITGELRRHFRDHSWTLHVPRRLKDDRLKVRAVTEDLSRSLDREPTSAEVADAADMSTDDVAEARAAARAFAPISLDQPSGTDDGPATDERFGREDPGFSFIDDCRTIAPLLEELPPRNRQVLELRFFSDLTQSKIADVVGVSQMQVSRILERTLADLRYAAV